MSDGFEGERFSERLERFLFFGLNHLLRHAETGAPSEYGTIEETIAPEALELIGEWIAARH